MALETLLHLGSSVPEVVKPLGPLQSALCMCSELLADMQCILGEDVQITYIKLYYVLREAGYVTTCVRAKNRMTSYLYLTTIMFTPHQRGNQVPTTRITTAFWSALGLGTARTPTIAQH